MIDLDRMTAEEIASDPIAAYMYVFGVSENMAREIHEVETTNPDGDVEIVPD